MITSTIMHRYDDGKKFVSQSPAGRSWYTTSTKLSASSMILLQLRILKNRWCRVSKSSCMDGHSCTIWSPLSCHTFSFSMIVARHLMKHFLSSTEFTYCCREFGRYGQFCEFRNSWIRRNCLSSIAGMSWNYSWVRLQGQTLSLISSSFS